MGEGRRKSNAAADASSLSLDEGIRLRVGLDANAMRIVASIVPQRRLEEILDEVAAQLGVDAAAVRAGGADLVRRLLELGFLTPAWLAPKS